MSSRNVILYHYDASPFATKVKNMLLVKRIPHKRVAMPMTLPRPDLSELLGVKYRRIPILAIGNDIYCDSSLIASVLERRFPTSEGYGTLFPHRKGGGAVDTGVVKAVAMFWTDRIVFPLGANMLPYEKFDSNFLNDRGKWMGGKLDVEELKKRQPETKSALASHLALLEEQLSDGREWLLDTELPSLADISAHFIFSWLKRFRNVSELLDGKLFPFSTSWVTRTSQHLENLQKDHDAPFGSLSGQEAAQQIVSGTSEDSQITGFSELHAGLLKVKQGDVVSVTPTDSGKVPTIGKLVGLNHEEVAIEVRGSVGSSICHFPRLNFKIQREGLEGAKL